MANVGDAIKSASGGTEMNQVHSGGLGGKGIRPVGGNSGGGVGGGVTGGEGVGSEGVRPVGGNPPGVTSGGSTGINVDYQKVAGQNKLGGKEIRPVGGNVGGVQERKSAAFQNHLAERLNKLCTKPNHNIANKPTVPAVRTKGK